jgi:arsenate reductase
MNRVLLLCKNNAMFSPIAEWYFKSFALDGVEVYSAGIEAARINPLLIKIMKEDGLDLSQFKPHSLHDFKHINFDYILTFDTESEMESHHFPSISIKYHYDFDKMLNEDCIEEDKPVMYQAIREKIKKTMKIFAKEHLVKV